MDAINGAVTKLFDVLLRPFEALGVEFTLIVVSGIFGILALIAFKHISYQKGILAAKNKIKAHLIEIRIYQNDLAVVAKAIGKVLTRNAQYLVYNFGPFVPLAVPFVFVLAQLVVRFAFVPVPVTADPSRLLAGQGTLITVEMAPGHEDEVAGLEIRYPEGLRPRVADSTPVRSASEGRAWQEIVAVEPGSWDLTFVLADGSQATKRIVAGDRTHVRWMQPERVQSAMASVLWPVEDRFGGDSPFARVHFEYPDSNLGWLPGGGVVGVLLWFLVASMAFGIAVLKPLGIQI